ncbi:hypothetical protein PR048_027212 [Dryococelus australis]|uniref:Uncharacterized protein n=1 Tax=Dryococelus australis TaxID=614101 RepID=A0ABQ9GG75_9NEOP|nr:hypothetical protein PR048_027212 [Dryococelus australis]
MHRVWVVKEHHGAKKRVDFFFVLLRREWGDVDEELAGSAFSKLGAAAKCASVDRPPSVRRSRDPSTNRRAIFFSIHQGEPRSDPGRVPGFSQVRIVPDDAVGRRVFSGISRFPRPFMVPLHTRSNHSHRLSRPLC